MEDDAMNDRLLPGSGEIPPEYLDSVARYAAAAGKVLARLGGDCSLRSILGRGKGGYSFLASVNGLERVLKMMHYEKSCFYDFGEEDKTALELKDHYLLSGTGIRVPGLVSCSLAEQYILKEYVAGESACALIARGPVDDDILGQLFSFSSAARLSGINLDYFPPNFIVRSGLLYYIDYETSPYSYEWSLENWGLAYWCNQEGMAAYLKTRDIAGLNDPSGLPHKGGEIGRRVAAAIRKFQSHGPLSP